MGFVPELAVVLAGDTTSCSCMLMAAGVSPAGAA